MTERELYATIDELESRNKKLENDLSSVTRESEDKIKALEVQIRNLKLQISENSKNYGKSAELQKQVDVLTKKLIELTVKDESVTELTRLSIDLSNLLENSLAPIRFKKYIDSLGTSNVVVNNLISIIRRIDSWSAEMKKIIKSASIRDVDIIDAE
jgi:chromosome segregation ATPase